MASANAEVEWVETTEEVVITEDGVSSETHLAGMVKLRAHFLTGLRGLVTFYKRTNSFCCSGSRCGVGKNTHPEVAGQCGTRRGLGSRWWIL